MIDPNHVPEVDPNETLARFILRSGHVRRSNQTVKPDAFIPHPYIDLSVTRHIHTTAEELRTIGASIANVQRKSLYGRADIQTNVCLEQKLAVNADPIEINPNHAVIVGWPAEKSEQKIIAQDIAASAVFVSEGL